MGTSLVRFAEMGFPLRLLVVQLLVGLQTAAVCIVAARVIGSVTPGLLNRRSLIAAWLVNLADSQRKVLVLVSAQLALAAVTAASPVFIDHLEQQRRNAFLLLLIVELVAGAAMAPFAVRFVFRRPTSKLPFIRRVAADLAAGRLTGAFAEIIVEGAQLAYPSVGAPTLKYAANAAVRSALTNPAQQISRRAFTGATSKPKSKRTKSAQRGPAKQRTGPVNRCRAKTADGTLCRNRVSTKGDRCHRHRRFFG